MYKLNVFTKEDSLPMMNQEGEYTDVSEIRIETKCKWQYKSYIFWGKRIKVQFYTLDDTASSNFWSEWNETQFAAMFPNPNGFFHALTCSNL